MIKYTIRETENHQPSVWAELGNGTFLSIPMKEANSDYQAYLAWVAEGNTAAEWKPEA